MSEQSAVGGSTLSERYARFIIRNRRIFMFVLFVVTAFCAWFIKDLDMRNDPDTLLPPTNKYVATNLLAEDTYGMGNLMAFVLKVKDGDIYQKWFIDKVQEVHDRLTELPYARAENFIDIAAKKIKYMGADDNGLVVKRMLPVEGISDDPATAKEQLAFLKEGIETNPVLAPMLVYMEKPDGTRCIPTLFDGKGEGQGCVAKGVYIIGDYSDRVKEVYLPWVRSVRALMDELFQVEGMETLVAGEPYFLAWMLAALQDKAWLFVVVLIIVAVVLWYEFRNWRGAVFPLVGVGSTICLTLGVMGISAFKLTTMMVLTPMLLLAVGIGHSVQITRRFMQEQEKLGDCEEAARVSISHTIVPATLAIITDMVGFATLATVDISFYKAYAYFGVFGMATLLITTTSLIPLLMISAPCTASQAGEGHAWEQKLGAFLEGLIRWPGAIIPLGFVVVVLGASTYYTKILDNTIGWTDEEVEAAVASGRLPQYAQKDDLMPGVEKGINYARAAFKKKSITIQHILKLNEIMPGVISVTIPIRGKEPLKDECVEVDDNGNLLPPGCYDPETEGAQGIVNNVDVLADMEAMENWMRGHKFIGYTGSYAQYIRLVHMLLTTEVGAQANLRDLAIPTEAHLRSIDPDDDRDPTEIVQMYNGLLEIMTEEGDMDSFITPDWNSAIIMGFVNTMDPRETHKVTEDILNYIEAHKNDKGFRLVDFGMRSGPFEGLGENNINLYGNLPGDKGPLAEDGPDYVKPGIGGFLGATEATRVVAWDNWLSGPLLTAAAVFLIAALIFRSVMVSVILMVMLFITLYAQYGLGAYLTAVENWSGNLAFHLQVALSIAMGLGIDYGIYMMSRLREEMQATMGNWKQSLRNTLNTTGSAIVISVIVLISCFIPLMNTDLANTWGLGVYITEALIIDVVTALTVLPMLVYWVKPKFVFGDR